MFQPILCMTCGMLLGDKAVIYRCELMEKINEIRKDKNIATTKILTDPTIEIDMVDLLERLRVESDCCRSTITSNMDLRDWY